MYLRSALLLLSVTLIGGSVEFAAAATALTAAPPVPLSVEEASESGIHTSREPIPEHYIVVLKESSASSSSNSADSLGSEFARLSHSLANQYGATVKGQWRHAARGMSVRMTAKAAAALAKDPRVSLVEEDRWVYANTDQSPATWGLDRVDQRDLPLNNRYSYLYRGEGVTAYIIDTGIRTSHSEFGGRAGWGANFAGDAIDTDCHGHGTHVAGTVGGATYGIAKGVNLLAVKVLGCDGSGSASGVISGIDWVIANKRLPAVVNLSLGSDYSSAVNLAVTRAINAGITVVVAAGNEGADACLDSPGSTPGAITVGATTSTDAMAAYSNWGACLDLFAPGSGITSASSGSDTATATRTGTSMASPHVTGAVALYLSADPAALPTTAAAALIGQATAGRVSNAGAGSPNRLLFTGLDTGVNLAVAKTGLGTVSSSPVGIDCGTTCSASFNSGTSVTLTATPDAGYRFGSWGGACAGSTNTCTVVLDAATSVFAQFAVQAGEPILNAAVLPSGRAVAIGQTATAFASVINSGDVTASGCTLALPDGVFGRFIYQTTDAGNALTGTPNTPASIASGATQGFVFGITPSSLLVSSEIALVFDCANASPAPSHAGLNTFILTAATSRPPDLLAIGLTPSADGVVRLPSRDGVGFFTVAAVNIGSAGTVTVSPDDGGRGLPLTLQLCETTAAAVLRDCGSSLTRAVAANETLYYTVFVTGTGQPIAFDPANKRLSLRFSAGTTTVGATNVTVMAP